MTAPTLHLLRLLFILGITTGGMCSTRRLWVDHALRKRLNAITGCLAMILAIAMRYVPVSMVPLAVSLCCAFAAVAQQVWMAWRERHRPLTAIVPVPHRHHHHHEHEGGHCHTDISDATHPHPLTAGGEPHVHHLHEHIHETGNEAIRHGHEHVHLGDTPHSPDDLNHVHIHTPQPMAQAGQDDGHYHDHSHGVAVPGHHLHEEKSTASRSLDRAGAAADLTAAILVGAALGCGKPGACFVFGFGLGAVMLSQMLIDVRFVSVGIWTLLGRTGVVAFALALAFQILQQMQVISVSL